MPGSETPQIHCRKEKEIAEICTDLKMIKKIVMGNGQEGLATTMPALAENVKELGKSVDGLKTGVNGFLRFQKQLEGEQIGKEKIRRRDWKLLTFLVTIILGDRKSVV